MHLLGLALVVVVLYGHLGKGPIRQFSRVDRLLRNRAVNPAGRPIGDGEVGGVRLELEAEPLVLQHGLPLFQDAPVGIVGRALPRGPVLREGTLSPPQPHGRAGVSRQQHRAQADRRAD